MDKYFHSVRLDAALCKGCTTCLQRCPTEAIRIRKGKAHINPQFCIGCGECIRVCPHHAKVAVYDKLDVMEKYEYTIALPAPSLYTQFQNIESQDIILNALSLMGFSDVVEVSAAAELVSEVSRKYVKEHRSEIKGPFISTACPSIVRLITIRFPNLLPNLLPLNPPVEVAARIGVHRAMEKTGLSRDKIGTVLISPCPAKVSYAYVPQGIEKSEIDEVVAIKDIYPKLLAHMKAVAKDRDDEVAESGKIGISWGARGGDATGLLMDGYLAADGMDNVIQVLEGLEDEKFHGLNFVELNACNGGCVGGVLTVENPFVAEARLKKLRKLMPVSVSHIDEYNPELMDEIYHSKTIEYEPVFTIGSNLVESFARLNRAERIERQLPGLDCGSCGAPTCKALAEDIVKGEAKENNCIYYLRRQLKQLNEEVTNITEELNENGNEHGEEELNLIKEYFSKISRQISELSEAGDVK